MDGQFPGLTGADGGRAEGQAGGDPGVGEPTPGRGRVLPASLREGTLVVGHLWPVGLGVPDKDDTAGYIDAHVSQLRTKHGAWAEGVDSAHRADVSRSSAQQCLLHPLQDRREHLSPACCSAAAASPPPRSRASSTAKASTGSTAAHQGRRVWPATGGTCSRAEVTPGEAWVRARAVLMVRPLFPSSPAVCFDATEEAACIPSGDPPTSP